MELTTIGDDFLSGCASLTKIDLRPYNLTKIGTNFLNNCTGLINLYLPTLIDADGKYITPDLTSWGEQVLTDTAKCRIYFEKEEAKTAYENNNVWNQKKNIFYAMNKHNG